MRKGLNTLAVIGIGLIGGSFARAVRSAGIFNRIIGFDRDESCRKAAVDLGVVDAAYLLPSPEISTADVIFIATPVCSILSVYALIIPLLGKGCIVTDGGSVKSEIVSESDRMTPEGVFFVGGHPIAGTEHSGVEASFRELFDGKRCVLTPSGTTDPEALEIVGSLWRSAGAEVVHMEPDHHDMVFAAVSHLPHMVAYALVHAVGHADCGAVNALNYAAGGFRDFTRIASSDPLMWRDIAIMNRSHILGMIDFFSKNLDMLRLYVANGSKSELEQFFRDSKSFRDGLIS